MNESNHLSLIRRSATEKSSSRLTSAVKPIMELLPSEAVIDIKPEMDDDLIAEDSLSTRGSHSRARRTSSRAAAGIYRPGQSRMSSAGHHSTAEGPAYNRAGRSGTGASSRVGLGEMWRWCEFRRCCMSHGSPQKILPTKA